MKVLSLFSGVGGFDLGLERAGMETVFQCEWDKHATKILEKHWPNVPRWDDVSTLTGEHILKHAPIIDVVAWGSPCQDLSVAGKRAGLEGTRSGLFHEGVRIIKELRELTNGKYPRISIWENVAGALSSGAGADFGQVLYEMDEAGSCFSEWRVLDAQYFGVPQRRRRVFLISVFDSATAARCPNPLLPLSESLRRDTQESTATGQEPASETAAGFGSSNFGGWAETDTAITLSARDHKSSNTIVGSLDARDYKGVGNQYVDEGKVVVEAFTKGKRAQTPTDDETWDENRLAPTLNQFDQGDTRATTIIAFASNQRAEVRDLEDKAVALQSEPGTNQQTFIAEPILLDGRRVDDVRVYNPPVQTLQARMGTGGNNVPVIGFSDTQGLSAQPPEAAWPTLRTEGNGMAVAIPTLMRQREGKDGGGKGPLISEDKSLTIATGNDQTLFQPIQEAANDVAGCLRSGGDGGVPSSRGEHLVIQYDGYNQKIHVDEPSVTLRIGRDSSDFVAQPVEAAGFKAGQSSQAGIGYQEGVSQTINAKMSGLEPTVMTPTMAVRRLTPLECERLMGWPDDWTAGQADTHRYKQCGNGVASPVATWIAQHLQQLDKDTNATPTQTPTT